MSAQRAYLVPLVAMLWTQVAGSAAIAAVPVVAPELAAELGVDASLVGVYTGVWFAAATVLSLASGGLIARLGAVRTNQLAVAGSGLGLLLALVPTVGFTALAALVAGAAYGPNTPSGSQVLATAVPARRRGLAFSVKQSGAALGAMLAGLALPLAVTFGGWRAALVATAAFCVLAALMVEPVRRRLDPRERLAGGGAAPSPLESMRVVMRDPGLRRITIGGVALMVAHGSYQSFTVAYLVEAVGRDLAVAGGLFAALQAGAAVSRVLLGWLADRIGGARGVLSTVAAVAVVAGVLTARFDASWSTGALGLVCVLAGIGSSGWYGVFLAEVARLGLRTGTGQATGGVLFFAYAALVSGPLLVSAVVAAAGRYEPAFLLLAAMSAVACAAFARIRPSRPEL